MPNHVEAFVKRLARPMPQVRRSRYLARTTRWFLHCHRDQLPEGSATVLPFEDWLEHTNYTGARKEALRKLEASLRRRRPDMRSSVEVELARRGLPVLRVGKWTSSGRKPGRDERVKSFIKNEWYETEGKAPREICARVDPCKILFGPLIKSFESLVYELKDDRGLPYFIKHVPVDRRPLMIQKLAEHATSETVFRGTDYSTFERVAVPETMYATEAPMYRWLAGLRQAKGISEYTPQQLSALTNTQLLTILFLDMITNTNRIDCGWFMSEVVGTRMSGEMNTSLGNGWLNLMLINAICTSHDCEWHGHVEGDDGIFALTPHPGGSVPTCDDYTMYGAEIKMTDATDLHLASFCGNVFDPVELKNLGDPTYFIATFGWVLTTSTGLLSDGVRHALLRAKAMSALAEYHGTPVIPSVARFVLRCTPSVAPRWTLGQTTIDYWTEQTIGPYLDQLSVKIRQWASEPTSSRETMACAYPSWDIATQLKVESYFDSLTSLQPLHPPCSFPGGWRHAWQIQVSSTDEVVLV